MTDELNVSSPYADNVHDNGCNVAQGGEGPKLEGLLR